MKKITMLAMSVFSLSTAHVYADSVMDKQMKHLFVINNDTTEQVLLNEHNKVVGDVSFAGIHHIKDTDPWRAWIQNHDEKEGYIDNNGTLLANTYFDQAKHFVDGIARVELKGKWGFIDIHGKYFLEPKYDNVTPFEYGFATVTDKKRTYFINRQGEKQFGRDFWRASSFEAHGLAYIVTPKVVPTYIVSKKKTEVTTESFADTTAYINTKGEIVKAQALLTDPLNEFNVARIRDDNNAYRLVNSKGEYVNDQRYKYMWEFSESGVAWTQNKDGTEGYINAQGEMVWKASYHEYGKEKNGLLVHKYGQYQFFDPFGKLVIKERSTWADSFDDPKVSIALRDEQWGILYRDGTFKPFGKDIIAPHTIDNWIIGFFDGFVPMLNTAREIVYFDRQGVAQYHFAPSSTGTMALTDRQGTLIWQSQTKNKPVYALFSKDEREYITHKKYRSKHKGKHLLADIKDMLIAKPRKYYIPWGVLIPDKVADMDFYTIADDVDKESIQTGAVIMVAHDYVDAGDYGEYDFLPQLESDGWDAVYNDAIKHITKAYGKPITTNNNNSIWHIADKQLTLHFESDSGDGDYYTHLLLEASPIPAKKN